MSYSRCLSFGSLLDSAATGSGRGGGGGTAGNELALCVEVHTFLGKQA